MKKILVGILLILSTAVADEGFWPYTAPPVAQVKERYGFELKREWLEHLMKSSARLGEGASGSFVSANGLFLTNSHVGAVTLFSHLNERDIHYIQNGFHARSLDTELPLPGAKISAVQSIEDVTARVEVAAPSGSDTNAVTEGRSLAIARIEKECTRERVQSCEVVALAEGARYELHHYREYTDIRLVFCPPESVGLFHSTTKEPSTDYLDTFNFDICLFRVYEHGAPARLEHHLKFSERPVHEGDLVFGSGFPLPLQVRNQPTPKLEYQRDVGLPQTIAQQYALISAISDLISRNAEAPPGAEQDLMVARMFLNNAQAELTLLQDPSWMRQRRSKEEQLRARFARAEQSAALTAYDRLDAALAELRTQSKRYYLFREDPLLGSRAFHYADELLTAASEIVRPERERQERYQQPRWGQIIAWLSGQDFDPIYKDVERVRLAAWLGMLMDTLGADDPFIRDVLAGRSPAAAAAAIMGASKIGDPNFHETLLRGDDKTIAATIEGTTDPFLSLIRRIKMETERLADMERARHQADLAESEIIRARYRAASDIEYPNATNTLRFTFGVVLGYEYAGRKFGPWSTFGNFNRWVDAHPDKVAKLGKDWNLARKKLSHDAPFNVVVTLDNTAGGSGTPLVNRAGDLVGVAFANAPSKLPRGAYDPVHSRALAVGSAAILEILRKIYGDTALAAELVSGHRVGT